VPDDGADTINGTHKPQETSMKKILVTGNMGYVGPLATAHLRATNPDAEIIGYDCGLFAANLTTREPLPETAVSSQHFGDVRDLPMSLLKEVDAVVHLAAVSNDPIGSKFEAVTEAINHRASLRLAQLAHAAGVRHFVFASSCSVYGVSDLDRAQSETDVVNPQSAYARSKIATEEGLRQAGLGGMIVSCLRFATACGLSPRLRLDLVLNDFVASAMATGRIEVLSDGSPWRPLIDVRDMARAIAWSVTRPETAGGAFLVVNVGSNAWNYRIRELAAAAAREIPGTSVSINKTAAPDRRSYRVDFSLFQSLAPEHTPRVDLAESVRRLKDGLTTIGFADASFRSSRLMRLRMIEDLMTAGRLTPDLRWTHFGAAA
jgi:nucleoside-diphosphate-sugar epimerase